MRIQEDIVIFQTTKADFSTPDIAHHKIKIACTINKRSGVFKDCQIQIVWRIKDAANIVCQHNQ